MLGGKLNTWFARAHWRPESRTPVRGFSVSLSSLPRPKCSAANGPRGRAEGD